MTEVVAFGDWSSPISGEILTQGVRSFEELQVDGDRIYWVERRPDERRAVLVRDDGLVLSEQADGLGSRVYEYGAGSTLVRGGNAWWVGRTDQRVYSCRDSEAPKPLTPEDGSRYGMLLFDVRKRRLLALAERRDEPGEPKHSIVAIPLEGGAPVTLLEGRDFYGSMAISRDGSKLGWTEWSHPHMPWDASEVHVGELNEAGQIVNRRRVAGGPEGAAGNLAWSPEGALHFALERNGWFNLHYLDGGTIRPLKIESAEHALPSVSAAAYEVTERHVLFFARSPEIRLRRMNRATGALEDVAGGFTAFGGARSTSDGIAFIGGTSTVPMSVWFLPDGHTEARLLRGAGGPQIADGYVSEPMRIEATTDDGAVTYGYYFRPQSPGIRGPASERPPLIVNVHGGPTAPTSYALRFGAGALGGALYWTSRGYGYIELDYRGSTGRGREYRRALYGRWGELEIIDALAVIRHLTDLGEIDPKRVAIRGGSSGGFSVLAATAATKAFKAGTAMFPVADLAALRRETHKLESHYVDVLVGDSALDAERSPSAHIGRISTPLLFIQGAEDRVCPRGQTIRMVEELKASGHVAEYLEFEGEAHGFIKASSIVQSLEAEERFYRQHLRP